MAYLSRETVKWVKIWLEAAEIVEGALFRRLVGTTKVGEALNPGSVAPLFKNIGRWLGLPAKTIAGLSGHSTRVGATQDLTALDIDLGAISHAGGWKSTRMPLKYAERILAVRSAMARAARTSGRDG